MWSHQLYIWMNWPYSCKNTLHCSEPVAIFHVRNGQDGLFGLTKQAYFFKCFFQAQSGVGSTIRLGKILGIISPFHHLFPFFMRLIARKPSWNSPTKAYPFYNVMSLIPYSLSFGLLFTFMPWPESSLLKMFITYPKSTFLTLFLGIKRR